MTRPKDYLTVHVTRLVVGRDLPRRGDLGDLRFLKLSLLCAGIREPIGVRQLDDDYYRVLNGRGYRRLVCIQELIHDGHEALFRWIPVQIKRSGDEAEDALDLLLSEVRAPMPVLTLAQAIEQALAQGIALFEIAQQTGYSVERLKKILETAGDISQPDITVPAIDPTLTSTPGTPLQRLDEIAACLGPSTDEVGKSVAQSLAILSDCLNGRIEPRAAAAGLISARGRAA